MPRVNYTREELIAICERAFVPESAWGNRDTAHSQQRLGEAYALLKAGCEFHVDQKPESPICATDDRTIWITIRFRGFMAFEIGEEGKESETFYLPTPARLEEVGEGKDWY